MTDADAGDVPPCPQCDSDRTHRIDGSRDGAYCAVCDAVFSIELTKFQRAKAELRDAVTDALEPWLIRIGPEGFLALGLFALGLMLGEILAGCP